MFVVLMLLLPMLIGLQEAQLFDPYYGTFYDPTVMGMQASMYGGSSPMYGGGYGNPYQMYSPLLGAAGGGYGSDGGGLISSSNPMMMFNAGYGGGGSYSNPSMLNTFPPFMQSPAAAAVAPSMLEFTPSPLGLPSPPLPLASGAAASTPSLLSLLNPFAALSSGGGGGAPAPPALPPPPPNPFQLNLGNTDAGGGGGGGGASSPFGRQFRAKARGLLGEPFSGGGGLTLRPSSQTLLRPISQREPISVAAAAAACDASAAGGAFAFRRGACSGGADEQQTAEKKQH